MQDLDMLFDKELRETLQKRAMITAERWRTEKKRAYTPYDVPYPKIPYYGLMGSKVYSDDMEVVYIRGLEDTEFSVLEGTNALVNQRQRIERAKRDYKGKVVRDPQGTIEREHIPLKRDHIFIRSAVKLELEEGYKYSEGDIQYIKTVKEGEQSRYTTEMYDYMVPKKYCYKVNQVALVMSFTKLRVYYYGKKLVLSDGIPVYLYVIPHDPTKLNRSLREKSKLPYKIIKVKEDTNFAKEMQYIEKGWLYKGVIIMYGFTFYEKPIRQKQNLVMENFTGTLTTHTKYKPYDKVYIEGVDIEE